MLLTKFLHISHMQKIMLIEASLLLLLARVALKYCPFKYIQQILNLPPKKPELVGKERDLIRDNVIWAIRRSAHYLPGKTVCFPRGIVAQQMLRRRNIGTSLYYGASATIENRLKSHVWVRDGSIDVVGCDAATGYKIIAIYPNINV